MTAGDVINVRGTLQARQGAAFDGVDDYILADAHAVARVAGNDTVGTYSAWIYKDNVTTTQTILSAGDDNSATEFLELAITSTAQLRILLYHGGANQFVIVETTGSIPAKTWTHVAVVQNGTQPALYVNGKNVAATNSTSTDLTMWYDELTGCDKFAIGVKESNATHTNDWAGMISDVKYWNKALRADEVLADRRGEALSDDATYLQLHLLKSNYGDKGYGITDQGLGADNGTLTGHAYLTGWGSEWSRGVELNAVVADDITTIKLPNGEYETLILKAA